MNRVHSVLLHIQEDAREAISFAEQAGSFEVFSENPLFRKAIIMSIINIGELTKRLSDEFKAEHSKIPWRKISGMRDIAAHGYHIMDEEMVWDVVKSSIPELLDFVNSYFESAE